MKRLILVCFFALGLHVHSLAATINWTGGGDGVSWGQAANWSNNILPTASDDVVISGVSTNVTITLGGDVTVQSLQCSTSLNVSGGNLSLTKGASQVDGNFTVTAGRSLSVSGSNAVFTANGSATLDGAGLYANSGAVLELPGIGQATRTGYFDVTWQAEGAGSRIVLAGLTNVVGYTSGAWWSFRAYNGGRVELPAVATLTNGWFSAYAEGTAAVVDLSGLTDFQLGRSDQYMTVEARNNGTVLVPQLTDGQRVVLTLRSGGTVPVGQFTRLAQVTLDGVSVTFSNLATLDDTSLYVQNGAVLELPGIGQATRTGYFDVTWQAEGGGSRIVLAGLTNVVGYTSGAWWSFRAYNGGRVELPAVTTLTNGWFSAYAEGMDAVVALSGLTSSTVGSGKQVQVNAKNRGLIDLSAVQSISGGSCSIIADGTGSVIDLSRLSAFATPLGASELEAINGGTILLPSDVFLLVNVAVQISGNPVLPPVVSAGASVSLYGRAWHSYWVEMRDTRDPASLWQLFTRVPQTNDLQVISGPPASWQAFRVREFVADPPILDLHPAGSQSAYLVLFGPTNHSYQVQTTANLNILPGDWAAWGASTGPMTNTFRILPSFPTTEAKQFLRAKAD